MGINITNYRIRIGTFSSYRHHRFKAASEEPDRSSKKIKQGYIFCQTNFRILLLILLVLVPSYDTRTSKLFGQHFYPLDRCFGTPRGVYSYGLFSILSDVKNFKWPSPAFYGYKPTNIIRPNFKCTNNFYARYTYGNRNNRGIKLSHWNAGNAHLENKKN